MVILITLPTTNTEKINLLTFSYHYIVKKITFSNPLCKQNLKKCYTYLLLRFLLLHWNCV